MAQLAALDGVPPGGGIDVGSGTDDERMRLRYLPSLDGLRSAAILAVLAYHGGYLRGGYLGVDLFFVLSGYLITALLLRESRFTGTVSLARFWARRARRLLPALTCVVLAVVAYAAWFGPATQVASTRSDGLATLFYVNNWHAIFTQSGYGAGLGGAPLFQHLWSLSIEEQFYLVWPLMVLGLLRWRRRPSVVVATATAVAVGSSGLLIGLSLAGFSTNGLYLGTHTRVAALAMGSALAGWQAARPRSTSAGVRATLDASAYLGVVVLALAWSQLSLTGDLLYRGGLTVCGLAATAIVAACSTGGAGPLRRLLETRVLRGLGLVSYGLYLWHWPIFVVLDPARTGWTGWSLFGLRVTVSVAVAAVSYRFVEQPVRRRRGRPADTFTLAGLQVGAACIALVAVGLTAPDVSGGGGGSVARAGAGSPTLEVWGDSVVDILAKEGMQPLAQLLDASIVNRGVWGCSPTVADGATRDGYQRGKGVADCGKDMGPTVRAERPKPTARMLMFAGFPMDVQLDGVWRRPCDAPYRQLYQWRLAQELRALGSDGVPVVLVLPPPIPSETAARQWNFDDGSERIQCLWTPMRRAAAAEGVPVVDLAAYLCRGLRDCDVVAPDTTLRRDGNHFEFDGAKIVASWIVPEVMRAAGVR